MSVSKGAVSAPSLESCLEPARERARSSDGRLFPFDEAGRVALVGVEPGKGGNAQSKLTEYSGLGGLAKGLARGIGLVAPRTTCGLPLKLLPDRALMAGDMGDSKCEGVRKKGMFAVSGLIRGGAGRGALGAVG